MDKKIGERVRLARKAAGLTQEQLAEMTGYGHKTSINKIEKGLSGMSPEKLQAVCAALGVSASYITTGIRVPGETFPRKGWADELVEAASHLSKARRIQLVEFCQFLTALDERDRENDTLDAAEAMSKTSNDVLITGSWKYTTEKKQHLDTMSISTEKQQDEEHENAPV